LAARALPLAELQRAFDDLGARIVAEPLGDFSALRRGAAPFCEVVPPGTREVAAVVRRASELGVPLRLRAQGHSLNGASLPQPGELLVSLRALRRARFDSPGQVTAGAGCVLWRLQSMLASHGFALPVVNDGYAGPTVGGYVAAGGFGPGSAEHGGFWDNVERLELVDGRGELLSLGRSDPRFPWLFGAMGQLGVVVEASLRIVPGVHEPAYPLGAAAEIPALDPQAAEPGADEQLFWFTLFVPEPDAADAHAALSALEHRHGALRYSERYLYRVAHRGGSAPLVYPEPRAFVATGAWGWLREVSDAGAAHVQALDRDFMELALGRPGWRRYIQTEFSASPEAYRRCFDPSAWSRFVGLKRDLDPGELFNRGSVFAAGTARMPALPST
jgi:FAD/FMN-containing dehydrogenase